MARNAPGFSVPEKSYIGGRKVRGPRGIDRVPAALTEGEFVIKRPSARKIGYGVLNHMNQTGEIPMRMAMAKQKGKQPSKPGRMRMRYQTGGETTSEDLSAETQTPFRRLMRPSPAPAPAPTPGARTATELPYKPMTNEEMNARAIRDKRQGVLPGMAESIKRRFFARGGNVGLRKGYAGGGAHPGFKAVQASIARKQGIPMKRAGAILAASSRRASPAAKRANPRLLRVSGA